MHTHPHIHSLKDIKCKACTDTQEYKYNLHKLVHLNQDNMQLLQSTKIKMFKKERDVHRNAGILLMFMRLLQRQTREVVASLCIVPLYLQPDWCLPRHLTAERTT